METFDAAKFGKRVFWVIVAIGVGIGTAAGAVNWQEFDWSWAAVIGFGYAVFRAAVGWWQTGLSPEMKELTKRFLVVALCAALAAGCISVPWYQNPLKSQGKIEIWEEQPDGYKFQLTAKDSGDGEFLKNFQYQGEAAKDVTPWTMSLNTDTTLVSPAMTRAFDSLDKLVTEIPGLASVLGPAPASGDERQTWLARLFAFLSTNPQFIPDVLRLLLGAT